MNTDDLVGLLARGPTAVDTGRARRRLALALGWGALASVLLMIPTLGVRADLIAASSDPMFWVKLGFVLTIAVFAAPAWLRVARPGIPMGARLAWGMAAPVLLVWALAVLSLARASPQRRASLFWGETWAACPLLIGMLSIPVFVLLAWALRDLAPTRPRQCGALTGVLAGSIGATAYALHCPEMSAPFLAVWYVLGVALPGVVGAAIGPRLLRW